MEQDGSKSSHRPLMLGVARECQSRGVNYRYDRDKCLNVLEGGTIPVVSVASHLLKSQGYAEDIG
jgi:hypothetical protein